MTKVRWALVPCWMALAVCACNSGKPAADPVTPGFRSEDLVGKWRLVRVDGKPLAEMSLKSQDLEIAADGTWTSNIAFAGQMEGMSMKGAGTWSLADGGVNYTNGQETGKSKVALTAKRLVLDPDFHLRKNDASKAPIVGEYERP